MTKVLSTLMYLITIGHICSLTLLTSKRKAVMTIAHLEELVREFELNSCLSLCTKESGVPQTKDLGSTKPA